MREIGTTSAGELLVAMTLAAFESLKTLPARLREEADILDGKLPEMPPEPEKLVEQKPAKEPPARPKPVRKTIGAKRCLGCGKEFSPVRKDQTCCSKVCRKKNEYKMRTASPAAPGATGTCPICNAAFSKDGPGGYKRNTCGKPECLAKWRSKVRKDRLANEQHNVPPATPANPEAGLPPKINRLDLIRQAHRTVEGGEG